MLSIKTKKIEKIFNKKVIPFITVLGLDTATRTGWCRITTDPDYVNMDYAIIHIDTTDRYFKYNEIIQMFSNLVRTKERVIIEDTYLKIFKIKNRTIMSSNPKTFRLISRIGAIAYTLAYLNKCNVEFLMASTARKNLGFKGNQKKKLFHKEFLKKLNIKVEDEDIVDAITLALNGILE